MAKKTKLSGLMDTSSWGAILATTEMGVTKKSEKDIRRMMSGSPFFRLVKGERMTGSCEWHLMDENDKFLASYEFNVLAEKKTFMNVRCNPTTLMAGVNDIPIIVKGFKGNSVLNTFKLANRLGYALLEYVPSSSPFIWVGQDRQKYVDGDIILKQMQFAWYSADLGKSRDAALHYVRTCYGGANSVEGFTHNLSKTLNINVNMFDDSSNISLTASAGNNKEFLLTLYAKDNQKDYRKTGENVERLQRLIRYDCTFYNYFIQKNRLNTIRDLEIKYRELCEVGGYDIGFFRWLSNYISDRLYLSYILPLNNVEYLERFSKMENGEFSANEQLLIDWWLKFNTVEAFSNMPEEFQRKSSGLGKNYKSYLDSIKSKTGIDLRISRTFHDAMLDNRKRSQQTKEERFEGLKDHSNKKALDSELLKRDRQQVEKMAGKTGVIVDSSGVLRLRKLSARQISYGKLHVFKSLGLTAARIDEINKSTRQLLERTSA